MQMRKVQDFEDEVKTDMVVAQLIWIAPIRWERTNWGVHFTCQAPKEPRLRGFPAEGDASGKAMGTEFAPEN